MALNIRTCDLKNYDLPIRVKVMPNSIKGERRKRVARSQHFDPSFNRPPLSDFLSPSYFQFDFFTPDNLESNIFCCTRAYIFNLNVRRMSLSLLIALFHIDCYLWSYIQKPGRFRDLKLFFNRGSRLSRLAGSLKGDESTDRTCKGADNTAACCEHRIPIHTLIRAQFSVATVD